MEPLISQLGNVASQQGNVASQLNRLETLLAEATFLDRLEASINRLISGGTVAPPSAPAPKPTRNIKEYHRQYYLKHQEELKQRSRERYYKQKAAAATLPSC